MFDEVQEVVFDFMFNLDVIEDQLDFFIIYGLAKFGWMSNDWWEKIDNIMFLFDVILEYILLFFVLEGIL